MSVIDPIPKLLEDDKEDTMHYGTDVEAFKAALDGLPTLSQPFESDAAAMSQGGNPTTNEVFQQWQVPSQDQIINDQSHQIREEPNTLQHQDKQLSSDMDLKWHDPSAENQNEMKDPILHTNQSQDSQRHKPPKKNQIVYPQPVSLQPKQTQHDHNRQQVAPISHQFSQSYGLKISEDPKRVENQNPNTEPHFSRLQRMNNQPTYQASNNPQKQTKSVPLALLLPLITPQLDKDRAMHLQTVYNQLRRNEIPKETFARVMKTIVGNQMLNATIKKFQNHEGHGPPSVSALKVNQGNSIEGALMEEITEKQSDKVCILSSSMGMVTFDSIPSSMTTQLDQNVSLGSCVQPTISPIGQKKPFDGLGSSPPLPSKKQKVSGGFLDQSIDQLNDVTAVSGVNLMEEERQLFSGFKKDIRVSEVSKGFVQEEEGRLILQKAPLQKKLEEIMGKCGINNIGKDVERCLSLCVEERIRELLNNLIRLSKQRVDPEKFSHQTVITSDVRHQIMMMNQTAKEELEKKQADAEQLLKLNDDGRVEEIKVNKEEDDKMRTRAANVAIRAAVGVDDMVLKWQLMAEQARQKRQGTTTDRPYSSQPSKDSSSSSGTFGTLGKDHVPQTKAVRNISVKDVISVVEREPQMSRSTLMYRLCNKLRDEPSLL